MMPDRYVTKHSRGWAVKSLGGNRASSVRSTQREAERAAKQTVENSEEARFAFRFGTADGRTPTRYALVTIPIRRATRSARHHRSGGKPR